MKNAFKRYWPYIQNFKLQYFWVFIGILLTVSATSGTAYIMKPMIDTMFIQKDSSMLIWIPLGLIGIYIVKSLGRYIQSVNTNYIGLHIITQLRTVLLRKILFMDMSYIHTNRSGEMISRITNDIGRVQYFVSNMLPEFIRETLTVAALVGYVIYLNATLAFYAFIVLPVLVLPLIHITRRLKRLSRTSQEKNADIVSRLTEVFNNTEIIKLNATENYELDRFEEENWRFFRINMKAVYTNELVSPLLEIIASVGLALVIYMGGKEVISSHMTPGEFFSFFTAVGLAFQPARGVGIIYAKMQDALAASERVFTLLDLSNSVHDGKVVLEEPIKSIRFADVSLHYGDKIALSDINLEIHERQTIALVGDSGGGKSTLINAIVRFYDTSKGKIFINNMPITQLTQHSLRDHIAVVSQRVYIFQDTLAANVAYGHEIDEKRVFEALKSADALEFAQSLSEGIHTPMEEAGTNLSGGQRQRIAIARAIYKKASVLILDEATSALDNETERRIQNALKEYTKDKITILIAHRLSTVEHADMILVFKQGRIVARGTHQELLENSSEYQRLSRTLVDTSAS
ncbi:MAG: ABC transporter transmembrane domain-containing protein [Sulfuricurvum sp.]|nr:ABC transporter transmembrane domain-containing protein [Sulfuricurvum sp.]